LNRINKNLREELRDINREELDQILGNSLDPEMAGYGKEVIVYKEALVKAVNSELSNKRE
jgi:hypothetical protein